MIAARNIRVVAAFSIAVFLAILGWKLGITEKTGAAGTVRALSAHSANLAPDDADSDKDGLADWEEALLGFDPQNKDSDHDGVADPDEPKVSVTNILSGAAASSSESSLPEDKIGERLIGEYLYLKDRGAFSEERGERLGGELARYVKYDTKFTPYTAADMTESSDDSSEAIERHRTALKEALDPFLSITEPEFALYARFVQGGDRTALEELQDRAALYKRVARDILQIPAPRGIATVHLETANALSFFALVLENMAVRADDPIASLALLKTYNQSEQYVQQTFGALTAYYREKLFDRATIL